jgi:hypothetical protein
MTAPEPTYGSGGPHGSRVYWPAGLAELEPADRAAALQRGWWHDGEHVVTRDGRRMLTPPPVEPEPEPEPEPGASELQRRADRLVRGMTGPA